MDDDDINESAEVKMKTLNDKTKELADKIRASFPTYQDWEIIIKSLWVTCGNLLMLKINRSSCDAFEDILGKRNKSPEDEKDKMYKKII